MEFDCYQHYFYDGLDTEEDFYKSTAPSEDIWKKFELLPTPPMSPTRTLSVSAAGSRGHLSGDKHLLSPGDKLSWLSKVLGQDEECEGQFLPDTEELFGINLSSIIIQDCMWSSFSASKQLEKVNERLSSSSSSATAAAAAHQQAARVPPVAPQITVRAGKAHCASSSSAAASPDASLTRTLLPDCVDPASVLTIPAAAAVASSCRKLPAASSGSESHSDSSDEDEEDDEEIDVVTVESKQNRARLVARGRKPMTVTVRADPCPKRFHLSVHRQQHNYAARSPDSEPEEEEEEEEDDDEGEYEEEPRCKRTFLESSCQQQQASCSAAASPSRSTLSTDSQSSDTEDTDRRRNHNFLERKRRNDLRSRFLALRDQVPGLVESAKTPKVAILTQATEYLAQLHTREKHQVLEKKRLRARQQQLLRKLAELKRS